MHWRSVGAATYAAPGLIGELVGAEWRKFEGMQHMSNSSARDDTPSDQLRLDPIECPHCGNTTMPNLLADRSYVCSCPAERALPTPDGATVLMAPPVDDTSFVASCAQHPSTDSLPGNRGQFGRDIQTDEFKRLRPPPTADE
jgi:hypothetical protein